MHFLQNMDHLPVKTFLLALCLLGAWRGSAHAGGPEVEMDKAHIDDVVFDERGLVLKVTGTVKLFAAKTSEDDPANGNAKWVTLTMHGGEIRYHAVNLDATTLAGYDKYRERIQSMKGTDQHIQMWGTEATITGGSLVTLITTNSGYPLTPVGDERRFRWEDLKDREDLKGNK